ncbi:MAG: AAA family ATPase [Hyphomicrobium sp.]
MEKIQQALEKARQARQLRAPLAAHPSGGSPRKANHPLSEIQYSETRIETPPDTLLEKHRVVRGATHNELLDTFRVLRTRVLQRLEAANYTTLGIVSANKGDGKTVTAINLAVSFAMNVAKTVLLVDADLRSPRIHQYFGLKASPGLQDYLLADVPLSSCLVHPNIERLVILPAGAPLPASSEVLSSPKMVDLAKEAKARYPGRIIIYDLPPLLGSDDAIAFMQHVDCALLVVADGITPERDVLQAVNLLDGRELIGTVLNKSKHAPRTYYSYSA